MHNLRFSMENATPTTQGNWIGSYSPPSGSFDEFYGEDHTPRPQWQDLDRHFSKIPPENWQRRELQLKRLIKDNGITFNVYSNRGSNARPWNLDMIPLAMSQKEADKIESALSQRANLLNIILKDVYGRQSMLQSSKMDPHLIFANPSFLHPCHGLLAHRDQHINIYAADLLRSKDGTWKVLSDRVESAAGLGYALENRMLMSRIFPKVLKNANTQSLQPFINAFCSHIESLAKQNTDTPNVALLTPGPNNNTYFEQSFLARNLGYTLAEGADLTVRNNRLYMKTIGGVQPVDVLLRRVHSDWVDPLEMRNDSLLGIPGLINAIRQGNLAVANGLGSGFVENPAMLAFLPWYSRNFLGENLEIPSVSTWWCGQEQERDYVLSRIDELVIKPTFARKGAKYHFGPLLSSTEKSELIALIRRFPERFCGQEIESEAMLPTYEDGSVKARQHKVRVFLVPGPTGWRMLPGGLGHYYQDSIVADQPKRGSKDIWVINEKSKDTEESKPSANSSSALSLRRHSFDLPSRTADNLFWLGRYIERSESQARLLRTIISLLLEETGSESHQLVIPFIQQTLPLDESASKLFKDDSSELDLTKAEAHLSELLHSASNTSSLLYNLSSVVRTASSVKERLSIDAWKRINHLDDFTQIITPSSDSIYSEESIQFLDDSLDLSASITGHLTENMTRSPGWTFLQIGRRIERSMTTSSILETIFKDPKNYQDTLFTRFLELSDCSITYRRRYLNTITPEAILDLIVFDETNPRSLIHQARELERLLTNLPHSSGRSHHPIDQHTIRFFSRIGLASPGELLSQKGEILKVTMESFFETLRNELSNTSFAIEQTYFAHTKPHQSSTPSNIIGQ
ncbi:circularly permuted type 2 ATP-grasp protein [Puniceicoccaceae bacterium K14]|nr:circularly permuted type 2 ATP-grasp protein [Puniceicoccaceae bacterium K14]